MADNQPKTARYFSKYRSLTIAVKSAYYKIVEDKRILVDGKRVVFTDGAFETTDANLVNELEARADFGTAFVRIPDSKTTDQMRESSKVIAEKDREIEELRAENARLKLKPEEGAAGGDDATDDLETMTRPQLVEVAEALGLPPESYKVGTRNVDIAEAIKVKRAEVAASGAGNFEE